MLIFDGDSGHCASAARVAEHLLPTGIPVIAWQSLPDLADLGLTEADVRAKVWWVGVDGRTEGGHRAIGRCIQSVRRWWSALGVLLLVPPVSWLAAPIYGLVSVFVSRAGGSRTV